MYLVAVLDVFYMVFDSFQVSVSGRCVLDLVCRSRSSSFKLKYGRLHQPRRVFLEMSMMSCSSATAYRNFFNFFLSFFLIFNSFCHSICHGPWVEDVNCLLTFRPMRSRSV
jgi:hypothetical protein